MPSFGLSPYQQLVAEWKDCRRCPLWAGRTHVVMCKGTLPADVAFVGEAPGEAEDTLGLPFVGPAGQMLDDWVKRALQPWQVPGTEGPDYNSVTYAYMNLLACIPRDEAGEKVHEPEPDSVDACAPRLRALVAIAQPKLVVCVGAVAASWTDPKYQNNIVFNHPDGSRISRIAIDHPARVLRAPVAHRGLMAQRAIVQIRTAVEQALFF